MQTKLRIQLSDASGSTASCSDRDQDVPIKYRLLSFTKPCSASEKGQVLSSSAAPSFSAINVASGVKSLGIDAIDSLGATVRICSPDISINAASAADLKDVFDRASSGLAGDAEAQKRLVSNVAVSLLSLYTATNSNSEELRAVKEKALDFLNNGSSTAITDATDATQAASSLNALVTLPGPLTSALTASAVSMFDRFSASSFALLASGAATVDFAIEVSPMLVGGSLNVLGKTASSSSSRRILAYKNGMEAAYSAIVSASKVQAFALAASQNAVVIEQAPSVVNGVRRLRSASAMASVILSTALFGVAVSVAPDADASSAIDVGVVVVVQSPSPFQDAGSAVLISPSVAVMSFNAATGSAVSVIRNVVEARFPVNQSSHDARVVTNGAGQRKGEGCVVYDGTRWVQSCAAGAYSSASNSVTCICNVTAATLAIAAAEFVIDCKGALGGSLVLDVCKTCGGSVTDAAKCASPGADDTINTAAIIGAVVGCCFVVVVAAFAHYKRNQKLRDVSATIETKPPQATVIAPPSEPHPDKFRPVARAQHSTGLPLPPSGDLPFPMQIVDTRPQAQALSRTESPPFIRSINIPAAIDASSNRNHSPDSFLPGSPIKSRIALPEPEGQTSSVYASRLAIRVAESALNQSRTFERVPTPGSSLSGGFAPTVSSADRYRHLLAMQRQLSDSHAAVISPSSPVEVGTAPSSPRVQLPAFHAQIRAQFEQPPRHASLPSERSASPIESSVDRHRRLQMMQQRLSSSGTIIPSDSPALILPPFPSASGQYGEIAAARMQRLQQRAVSPPKQTDQVWSNMQVSPRPAFLQSPNRARLPDPEQLTRPF